jgi:hypothetical protein
MVAWLKNQFERLFNTHRFYGKGLLFYLYSKLTASPPIAGYREMSGLDPE